MGIFVELNHLQSRVSKEMLIYKINTFHQQSLYAIRLQNKIYLHLATTWRIFTLILSNKCLLNVLSASILKVLQCCPKLVKMFSECQTAWIWVRRRVTRLLIQIQAVCIWNYICDWLATG